MIKLLATIPREVCVAVSAGVDSMALLDFLQRKHRVTVAFFDHNTPTSSEALQFLGEYCSSQGLPFITDKIAVERPRGKSLEEHWRDERYRFLESIGGMVVTAHHLDDQVENWIFTSLNGNPRLIPLYRNNVMRPLLSTPKEVLRSWCVRKEVPWCEDVSNQDVKYMRNLIRHELMPVALKINPGISKVVKKMVLKMVDNCEHDEV